MDKKVISCAFNIDTACVEVRFVDGSKIAVDCTLVEAEVARNMFESSELEWLVYNAPADYVNLLLHGDVREYLRNVTEYRGFDNGCRVRKEHQAKPISCFPILDRNDPLHQLESASPRHPGNSIFWMCPSW